MPDFFFHLTNGDTFQDDRAVRCRTLEEAKTMALSVAAELGRNRAAREIENLAIRVTDKAGKEVFRTKVVNLQRRTKADDILRAASAQDGLRAMGGEAGEEAWRGVLRLRLDDVRERDPQNAIELAVADLDRPCLP
jgi:hypothetical protein